MKKVFRWLCPVLFLLIAAAVVWFLHLFTVMDTTMEYINWESSVQIMDDGSEVPFSQDIYSNSTEISGTYRFTGHLPENLSSGYLLFEISGASLTLSLNGTEIYQSSSLPLDESLSMSQAQIPLQAGTTGEVVMTLDVLDSSCMMFPPLVRFIPDGLESVQTFAIANRAAFPAGAAALAFLLIVGIFFINIMFRKPDWSLLALIAAAAGLISHELAVEQGTFFLPASVSHVLAHPAVNVLTILALILYLILNRRRRFWKYLGIVTGWSAAAILIGYVFSVLGDKEFSSWINTMISTAVYSGYSENLLYWVTMWLTMVCTAISAFGTLESFARQQTEVQNLSLRNKLVLDSYQAIENKMQEGAALRHEMKHNLTALDYLCQKGNYDEMKKLLDDLLQQNDRQTQIHFTENFTINAILQDAAVKASQADTAFDAVAKVPADLPIPEQNLCILLMNMLDNAVEACEKIKDPGQRFIKFRCGTKNGFLTVQCKNSWDGNLKQDRQGHLQTTKENDGTHGYGLKQMAAIAGKYHSVLDITRPTDGSFMVQTALKIPETPE